jgi:hypothetical protein
MVQPLSNIFGHGRKLIGGSPVQIYRFSQRIDYNPAVLAIAQVALKLRAQLGAQVAIDIRRERVQQVAAVLMLFCTLLSHAISPSADCRRAIRSL